MKKIFKWFSHQKPTKISEPANIEKYFVYQIQSLVGVTQADFQSLYVATIERFSKFLAESNQAIGSIILDEILTKVILTLKRRRGYLLPIGSDSETSFREREEWTYAVFIAALFSHIEKIDKLSVVKVLIPKEGFNWLQRNHTLFLYWSAYLSESTNGKNNIFSEIIDANNKQEAIVIEEDGVTPIPIDIDVTAVSQPSILDLNSSDFFQWIKAALVNKVITVNEPNSFVHGVQEGILICIPQAIDTFIKAQQIMDDQMIINRRITLIKEIKKYADLVRNSKNSRIHSYYWDRWEDRRVFSGIVILPKTLEQDNPVISINRQLAIDVFEQS